MDKQHLFDQLSRLYTQANLNHISSWIISAFKSKQHRALRDLVHHIPDPAFHSNQSISKIFTQLMMLYHPDKLSSIHQTLEKACNQNQIEKLEHFLHISSTLAFIETCAEKPPFSQTGKTSRSRNRRAASSPTPMDMTDDGIRNFVSALKQKEYGNLDVVYHEIDLIHVEGDLELSGYRLGDLSGLELCQNLTGLDLSDNFIHDIWALGPLVLLEELNLSLNRISSITALETLNRLRILDLSFNDIEDIASLYDLERLEYVNLIGNPLKEEQLHPLKRRGVVVVL